MLTYPGVSCSVALCGTFLALSRKFGKGYCYPSQLTILKLIERFYGVRVCRATLNNYLRVLEQGGYIRRVRRIRSCGVDGMRFDSTLYVLQKKAYQFLYRFGSSLSRAGVRVFSEMVRHSVADLGAASPRALNPDPRAGVGGLVGLGSVLPSFG